LDKYYHIRDLKFLADKYKIYLSNIKLNKNLEIVDFEKLEIKTFLNEIKNNDFLIDKSAKIIISGEVFDIQPLLKSLYKQDDRKTFSKDFNSQVKININKFITGSEDDVSDFAMIAKINKGKYEKLSLKGNFSENEIVEMSIYQVDKDKKILQIISDRARPFVKNFGFIKGFEGGKLDVSSRGMGSLDQKNGANYVRDDFYLATAADIVADPSAPNAFVEGIMEGKEWVWNNGALVEAELVELRRKFDVKKRQRDAKIEALEFAKFLKRL